MPDINDFLGEQGRKDLEAPPNMGAMQGFLGPAGAAQFDTFERRSNFFTEKSAEFAKDLAANIAVPRGSAARLAIEQSKDSMLPQIRADYQKQFPGETFDGLEPAFKDAVVNQFKTEKLRQAKEQMQTHPIGLAQRFIESRLQAGGSAGNIALKAIHALEARDADSRIKDDKATWADYLAIGKQLANQERENRQGWEGVGIHAIDTLQQVPAMGLEFLAGGGLAEMAAAPLMKGAGSWAARKAVEGLVGGTIRATTELPKYAALGALEAKTPQYTSELQKLPSADMGKAISKELANGFVQNVVFSLGSPFGTGQSLGQRVGGAAVGLGGIEAAAEATRQVGQSEGSTIRGAVEGRPGAWEHALGNAIGFLGYEGVMHATTKMGERFQELRARGVKPDSPLMQKEIEKAATESVNEFEKRLISPKTPEELAALRGQPSVEQKRVDFFKRRGMSEDEAKQAAAENQAAVERLKAQFPARGPQMEAKPPEQPPQEAPPVAPEPAPEAPDARPDSGKLLKPKEITFHTHEAQKQVPRKATGWILGEDGHWEQYPEPKRGTDITDAASRNPVPMPEGTSDEARGLVSDAWNAVSRLWPDQFPGIKKIVVADLSGHKYRAAISEKGTLYIPSDNPLSAQNLWHELVHLEQRAQGRTKNVKSRSDKEHIEAEREAYARQGQIGPTLEALSKAVNAKAEPPPKAPPVAPEPQPATIPPEAAQQPPLAENVPQTPPEAAKKSLLPKPPQASLRQKDRFAQRAEKEAADRLNVKGPQLTPEQQAEQARNEEAGRKELFRQDFHRGTWTDEEAKALGLTDREVAVLRRRDMAATSPEEHSFRAIGRDLGVSGQMANKIEKSALAKLGIDHSMTEKQVADGVDKAAEIISNATKDAQGNVATEALGKAFGVLSVMPKGMLSQHLNEQRTKQDVAANALADEFLKEAKRANATPAEIAEADAIGRRNASGKAKGRQLESAGQPSLPPEPPPVPGEPRQGVQQAPAAGASAAEGTQGAAQRNAANEANAAGGGEAAGRITPEEANLEKAQVQQREGVKRQTKRLRAKGKKAEADVLAADAARAEAAGHAEGVQSANADFAKSQGNEPAPGAATEGAGPGPTPGGVPEELPDRGAATQPRAEQRTVAGSTPERTVTDAAKDLASELFSDNMGIVHPHVQAALDMADTIDRNTRGLRDELGTMASKTYQATYRLNKNVGDAMARVPASDTYPTELVKDMAPKVLEGAKTRKEAEQLARKLGDIWLELRFRKAKKALLDYSNQLTQQANAILAQAQANGTDPGPEWAKLSAESREALNYSKNMPTRIGAPDSQIKTPQDFQNALNSREWFNATQVIRGQFKDALESNTRRARGMEDADPIADFTQVPGMPFHAEAIRGEEKHIPMSGAGNLNNLKQKTDPFQKMFTGSADAYENNIVKMMEYSLRRTARLAAMNDLYKTAIEEGVATRGRPGQKIEGTVDIPFNKNRMHGMDSLYVDERNYGDWRKVLRVDEPIRIPGITPVLDLFNRANFMLFKDMSFHVLNQIGSLLNINFKGFTAFPDYVMGRPEFKQEFLEIAKEGMTKPTYDSDFQTNWFKVVKRFVDVTDKVFRVALKRTHDDLVARGLQTEGNQALRDFANANLGNYYRDAQGKIVTLLRDTKLGPTSVAATTFLSAGLRSLFGGSGLTPTSTAANVQLRATKLAKMASILSLIPIANYLAWGRWDGDDSTPLLAIKTGERDGKTQYWDVLGKFTGVLRGAELLGLRAFAEGWRKNQTRDEIQKNMLEQSSQQLLHSAEGPGVTALHVLLTGKNVLGQNVTKPESPDRTFFGRRLEAVASNINPTIAGLIGADRPNEPTTMRDRLTSLIAPYGTKSRRTLTNAEQMAMQFARNRMPTEPDEAAIEKSHLKREARDALQQGDSTLLDQAKKDGKISPREALDIRKSAKKSTLEQLLPRLTMKEAVRVFDTAHPEEQEKIKTLLRQKYVNAVDYSKHSKQDVIQAKQIWQEGNLQERTKRSLVPVGR